MSRQLLILRHAKSDWNSTASSDFDRPLSKRGKSDAPRIGNYLKEHDLVPDYVVASPAKRARQTAMAVCEQMGIEQSDIHYVADLYLASLQDFIALLDGIDEQVQRLMLVSHNPGVDELLLYLVDDEPEYTQAGKLMTTAACAVLDMPDNWKQGLHHRAHLQQLLRPKDI